VKRLRRALLAGTAAAVATPWLRVARAADAPGTVLEVESGVFMVLGARGQPTVENEGRIGNTGFIVGRSGVIVIDTGISRAQGEALLAAVAQTTPLPVKLALITTAHQEFLFGASALQARGIPVHMQRRAIELMNSRCEGCLKTLNRELGEARMRGTAVFKPDAVIDESTVIETIGRPVFVQHHGHSSGPGDISVFDVRSGSLFAGSLLANQRIPDIQDSQLAGWMQALSGLRTLRLNAVVPGFGPLGGAELINSTQRYLLRLQARVTELLQAGTALSEVPDAAALPEYANWDQYDIIHRRNASILFLRLERALLLEQGTAKP
jgi:glyoxylase-like metal-dependent hydrolase (beta-lactamase superfamily II)